MEWELWLVAFVGASLAISLSPGAGAIQSATGLRHGVRRGYWSIAGLQIGLMLQLALVAVGLGAIVAKSVLMFTVIKWVRVAGPGVSRRKTGGARCRRTSARIWGHPSTAADWLCLCVASRSA